MSDGSGSDIPIRVLLVVDIRLYREGLAAILPRERLAIVGTVSGGAEALTAARRLHPSVAIVDVAVPGALDLIRTLRAEQPTIHHIAFAVTEDIEKIVDCAEAGAAAYVSANAGMDELVKAIEGASDGELSCSPRIAAELFRRIGDESRVRRLKSEPSALSARERQVLALLRQSLSNKEIAETLSISQATVKNHVHRLLEKLRVPSRMKAAQCLPRPNRAALRAG